jgi:hypothetical protein
MIRWPATTEYVFHLGVLGQAAYLAAARGYRPVGWLLFLALMTRGAVVSLHLVRSHLSDPPAPRLPAL